jgi:hypothetical protein
MEGESGGIASETARATSDAMWFMYDSWLWNLRRGER